MQRLCDGWRGDGRHGHGRLLARRRAQPVDAIAIGVDGVAVAVAIGLQTSRRGYWRAGRGWRGGGSEFVYDFRVLEIAHDAVLDAVAASRMYFIALNEVRGIGSAKWA